MTLNQFNADRSVNIPPVVDATVASRSHGDRQVPQDPIFRPKRPKATP